MVAPVANRPSYFIGTIGRPDGVYRWGLYGPDNVLITQGLAPDRMRAMQAAYDAIAAP
jgi:hypothetical protein